jgi:hypothetical protein
MKKSTIGKLVGTVLMVVLGTAVVAQQQAMQYFRPYDQNGVNVFETSKKDTVQFNDLKVRLGGGFAMQFQGLTQKNSEGTLAELGSDFNLPTANLNIDAQLHNGIRMHLRTYLSARHHNEAWIKGGNVQIDNLDFIKPGFLSELMQYATLRVGLDEFNYGDAHFRRSDNAQALYNPFVENYIMDAFSTEAFGELTLQKSGFLMVVGVTNGKLNQNVVTTATSDNKPSFFGKVGYDNQLSDDLRVRLTGSIYTNHGTTTGTWLYGGDRAGSRYYNVLRTVADANGVVQGSNFDGRYNARFTKLTAIQVNPFIKFKGVELFGVYEVASGSEDIVQNGVVVDKAGSFTQLAGELIYRFGAQERYYVGGRYNTVYGKAAENAASELKINRSNMGAGWFLTRNILTKIEYVEQRYAGDAWTGRFSGAEFKGIMVEATIGF